MSIRHPRVYVIECDACEATIAGTWESPGEAQKTAHLKGWYTEGLGDVALCPKCQHAPEICPHCGRNMPEDGVAK